MEENLWPETVYLVGAKDKIINRDLNIGYEKDTFLSSGHRYILLENIRFMVFSVFQILSV